MPTRRDFIRGAAAAGLAALAPAGAWAAGGDRRPNILFITADDLNYDSLGVTGCRVPGISPNVDRLASEGMRFAHAHVTAAICQPCRQSLMTGRYPHCNSQGGFHPIRPDVPTLQEQLRAAGYTNAIFSKVAHLAPQERYCWDTVGKAADLGGGRNPKATYEAAVALLREMEASSKPFFFMANTTDPHRPFPGSEQERNRPAGRRRQQAAVPPSAPPAVSRVYRPEEAEVPGFLPDLPDVRKELAQYFTGVHRCDETVGAFLRALRDAGLEENTLVMFISDNGMSFPYSKTNCYLNSTRTPWIVRWPGVVKPGVVETRHLVNGIDFTPTILEAAGLSPLAGVQGRSFLPLLRGQTQEGRDHLFTEINSTSAQVFFPMRCVQTRRFGYIFNAWSDGPRAFKSEAQAGLTFKAMQAAAANDPKIAERVRFYLHRVPEELYDFEKDPDALRNLVDDPQHREELRRLRGLMREHLAATQDTNLKAFRKMVTAA